MTTLYTQGREFVCDVRPLLERKDADALAHHVRRYWPNGSLLRLIDSGHDDAKKVALFCLSVTGTMDDAPVIARALHDEDPETADLAERALWSIWLQAADDNARCDLTHAIRLIDEGAFDEAVAKLDRLIARRPTLAEAHNQRAIACFLRGDYAGAIESGKRAVQLNPYHFGALAGLGHSYTYLGLLEPALEAYQRAMAVHPRLEGIRQSIQQVRECIRRRHGADSRSTSV